MPRCPLCKKRYKKGEGIIPFGMSPYEICYECYEKVRSGEDC